MNNGADRVQQCLRSVMPALSLKGLFVTSQSSR
uniref:Uncharacterized protein n=1 Tax=Anguilla anguilla TaxID=7936 RepID=A0A0E9VBN3_ANGAN